MGSHVLSMWMWVSIAIMSTINGHCGYKFPFSPFGDTRFHDFHHSDFNSNYGSIGLLDYFHGTDKSYRKILQQQQNQEDNQQ